MRAPQVAVVREGDVLGLSVYQKRILKERVGPVCSVALERIAVTPDPSVAVGCRGRRSIAGRRPAQIDEIPVDVEGPPDDVLGWLLVELL
jgi:hypothetical protein